MSLLEPSVPDDFDAFWQEAVAEATSAPLDGTRSLRADADHPTHQVEAFSFRGVDGTKRHGWFAAEPGTRHERAFLWLPPYGRWSMPPNAYGTRPGYVSLSLNYHGESAFHEEAYTPARGYFAHGSENPRTWVFRRMLQDSIIVHRFLAAQVEVDESRIAAMGMSQGGGIAIWLGAVYGHLRAIAADMPFFGGVPWIFSQPVHRYPLKELIDHAQKIPLGLQQILHTAAYYDTINMATRCQVPTLVTYGTKDPAVRPDQVKAIYEALAGEKEIAELDWGHDWHPSMVERNLAWLDRHLA